MENYYKNYYAYRKDIFTAKNFLDVYTKFLDKIVS